MHERSLSWQNIITMRLQCAKVWCITVFVGRDGGGRRAVDVRPRQYADNTNQGTDMEIDALFEMTLKITRDGVNRVAVYYGTQRLNLTDEDYNHFESILEDYEADDRWHNQRKRKQLIFSAFAGEK